MPGAFRTLVRLSGAVALCLISWNPIQADMPMPPKAAIQVDSTAVPSQPVASRTVDSIPKVKLDSVVKRATLVRDSLFRDSLKAVTPVFRFLSPWELAQECRQDAEDPADCWRRDPDLANVKLGFPGTRGFTLSLTNWQPVPIQSPYFPAWRHSPYLNGGLAPPEVFALKKSGGDVQGLEEIWSPVVPVDTPMTRLYWERGPITLNVFDLRLRRMLSDRVYLGLDYFSSSADSQTYDYQFNVHQPYLGGLGILGQIYGPIDRDSASLVLEGLSHNIQATAMRPRIGFWLDSNRVLEAYFDRVKNATTLTLPMGPNKFGGETRPGAVDSLQTLTEAGLASLSEGLIYGETRARWTSQWEAGHTGLTVKEFRSEDSSAGAPGVDEITAEIFKVRGTWSGRGLPLKPYISMDARSETWNGQPVLTESQKQTTGWTDAEDVTLALHPYSVFTLDAGLGRNSRMDNRIYWLPHFGGAASLPLPLGLGAEAGFASRRQDADWEVLYCKNPARFRYPNPDLKPRTDESFQGSLSWSRGRFSVDGGLDFFRSQDAWLPRVLPGPKACADLADSLYARLETQRCTVDTLSGALPDSLALALRNYGGQSLDGWHLGLGMGLGNWTLQLRNRFLVTREITDSDLLRSREDLSVPARVFKGRLAWKRSLVDDKLKLDLAWDWEWYSTRYGWVPDMAGTSKIGKLDEYLALDFQAAMHIKTFTLFFRSMNMNHDRYATEPGVHPPGINFRFGVDWNLTN